MKTLPLRVSFTALAVSLATLANISLCSGFELTTQHLNPAPNFEKSLKVSGQTVGIPLVGVGANRTVVLWVDVKKRVIIATYRHRKTPSAGRAEWKFQSVQASRKLDPVHIEQIGEKWVVLFDDYGISIMTSNDLDSWPTQARLFSAKPHNHKMPETRDLYPMMTVNPAVQALIVVLETTDPEMSGKLVGKDRDIFSVTGLFQNNLYEETSWLQPVGVNSDVERDTSLERFPWVAASKKGDKIMAAWRAVNQIHVAFSSGFACQWQGRKVISRVEEFKGSSKSQDPVIVTNSVGTWVVIWVHKDYSIFSRRFVERPDRDWLDEDSGEWGRVTPVANIAFPFTQLNFLARLVNDPSNPRRWAALWDRIDPTNSTLSHVVMSVSVDDGITWSLTPVILTEDTDYATSPSMSCEVNGRCTLVYGTANREIKSVFIPSDALFNRSLWRPSTAVPLPIDATNKNCHPIEFSQDRRTVEFAPEHGYEEELFQCWEIRNPDAHNQAVVELEVEVLVDIEPASMCPFDFISVSERRDFGLAVYPMPKEERICRRGRYHFVSSPGETLWVIFATNWNNQWGNFGKQVFLANASVDTSGTDVQLPNRTSSDLSGYGEKVNVTKLIRTYEEALTALAEYDPRFRLLTIQFATPEVVVNEEPALVIKHGMNVAFKGFEPGGTRVVANVSTYPCGSGGNRRKDRLFYISEGGQASFTQLYIRNGYLDLHSNKGGAMYNKGNISFIHNCTFTCNGIGSAGARLPFVLVRGGAIANFGHIDRISDTLFSKNGIWARAAGAIDVFTRASIRLIENCVFFDNRQRNLIAMGGGAMQVTGWVGTIRNTLFESNRAFGNGGAIYAAAEGRVDRIIGCTFKGNSVNHNTGGAISVISSAPLEVSDCIFEDNKVNGKGGAIYFSFHKASLGAPKLQNLSFINNRADSCAGAICMEKGYLEANLRTTIESATFVDNKVMWDSMPWDHTAEPRDVRLWSKEYNEPHAGAVAIHRSLVSIKGCEFYNNAGIRGGAVGIGEGAVGLVVSSTFANNTALAQGGALYTSAKEAGTTVEALFCDFVSNKALSNCRHQVVYMPHRVNNSRLQCDANVMIGGTIDPYSFDCRQRLATYEESLGCSHGVGGAMSIHGNVEANLHACRFAKSDVPNVDRGTYVAANGVDKLHLGETGQDIYTDVRIRATNCTFSKPIVAGILPVSRENTIATCSSSPFFACQDANSRCKGTGPFNLTFVCTCEGAFVNSRVRVNGVFGGYVPRGCQPDQIPSVQLKRELASDPPVNSTKKGFQAIFSFAASDFLSRQGFQHFEVQVVTTSATGESHRIFTTSEPMLRYSPEVGSVHQFRAIGVFRMNGVLLRTTQSEAGVLLICGIGQRAQRKLEVQANGPEFECVPCPRGTYLVHGDSMLEDACVRCPGWLPHTRYEGATSVRDCLPPPFTFIGGDNISRPCPGGATCGNDFGTHITQIGLLPGWWRPNATSTELFRCDDEVLCLGSNVSADLTAKDFGRNVWENTAYCVSDHTGPHCVACVENYTRAGTYCEHCDEERTNAHGTNLGIFAFLLVLVYALILLVVGCVAKRNLPTLQGSGSVKSDNGVDDDVKKRGNQGRCSMLRSFLDSLRSKVTILIGFFQVLDVTTHLLDGKLTVLPTEVVPSWLLAVMNLNVGYVMLPGVSCVIHNNHHNELYLALCMFALIVGGPLFFYGCTRCCASKALHQQVKYYYSRLVFFLIFLTYPSTCSLIFSTFTCDQFGNSYALRVDYSIDCGSDEHKAAVKCAIAMIVVYAVGLPIALAWLLYSRRKAIVTANVRSDLNTQRLAKEVSIVTGRYKRECFWYEVVDIMRKLFQSGFIVLIASGTGLQLSVAIVFCAAAGFVVTQTSPFLAAGDKTLELIVQTQLMAVLLVMSASYEKLLQDDNDFAVEVATIICIVWASPVFTVAYAVTEQFGYAEKFACRSYSSKNSEDTAEIEEEPPVEQQEIAQEERLQPKANAILVS